MLISAEPNNVYGRSMKSKCHISASSEDGVYRDMIYLSALNNKKKQEKNMERQFQTMGRWQHGTVIT